MMNDGILLDFVSEFWVEFGPVVLGKAKRE